MTGSTQYIEKNRNYYRRNANRLYFSNSPTPYENKKSPSPNYASCGIYLTVKHILT